MPISTQLYGTRKIPNLQVRHYRARKVLRWPPGPHNGAGSGCMWQEIQEMGWQVPSLYSCVVDHLTRRKTISSKPHKGSRKWSALGVSAWTSSQMPWNRVKPLEELRTHLDLPCRERTRQWLDSIVRVEGGGVGGRAEGRDKTISCLCEPVCTIIHRERRRPREGGVDSALGPPVSRSTVGGQSCQLEKNETVIVRHRRRRQEWEDKGTPP